MKKKKTEQTNKKKTLQYETLKTQELSTHLQLTTTMYPKSTYLLNRSEERICNTGEKLLLTPDRVSLLSCLNVWIWLIYFIYKNNTRKRTRKRTACLWSIDSAWPLNSIGLNWKKKRGQARDFWCSPVAMVTTLVCRYFAVPLHWLRQTEWLARLKSQGKHFLPGTS